MPVQWRPDTDVAAVNVTKLIAKNLKKFGKPVGIKPCVLIKVTPGTRTVGRNSGGTNPTEASHKARGMVERYSTFSIANTLASADDRKISILAATIAGGQAPTSGDKVTIEGVTYRILEIEDRDPASVMYTMKCRI